MKHVVVQMNSGNSNDILTMKCVFSSCSVAPIYYGTVNRRSSRGDATLRQWMDLLPERLHVHNQSKKA